MENKLNNSLSPEQKSDKEIIKKILSEKESDNALKDKMYRIIYEASSADAENMDTDLIDECIETISMIENDQGQIPAEKIKDMCDKADISYREWRRKEQKRHFSIKKAAVFAASFVLFFSITFSVANAFGYNLIQIMVQWGGETFNLAVVGQPKNQDTDNSGQNVKIISNDEVYSSIEEAIKGVQPVPMLPGWVPDGFTFEYAEKVARTNNTNIFLYYTNSENEAIIFDMTVYKADAQAEQNTSFEKDDSDLQIYEKNNIKHYIFRNIDQFQAVWYTSNIVYNVSGDISAEKMIKIINAMYGG